MLTAAVTVVNQLLLLSVPRGLLVFPLIRPMAPFLLFIIIHHSVLKALPQYFLLLPPSLWVNVEVRDG